MVKSDCVSLWIGDALGAVERACLRSIMRHGHRLALYCYGEPAGVPDGVEVRDAGSILPQSAIFRQPGGSVGHFADWFRYELQRRALGTWVDTDIYLLRPIEMEPDYLFGEQEPGVINNGVLRLPPQSPVLIELLRPFQRGTTPDWLPWRSRIPARVREIVGGKVDFARLPWGSTGPHALTALARKHGLLSKALPPDIFYPAPWQEAGWIRNPEVTVEQVATDRTIAVHLWNECIKGFKDEAAPEGSFLARLQREGDC